jgi:hypothetical protein
MSSMPLRSRATLARAVEGSELEPLPMSTGSREALDHSQRFLG